MSEKKKRRLSFAILLQSRKFLMIVSALLAVGVWWSVMSTTVDDSDRSLTISYPVDLSGSYSAQMGLRLVEDATVDVTVVVKGPWSVVSSLTADDLRVRADLSTVQKSGKQQVQLSVSRNSAVVDYDIVSYYPAAAEIWCDYWSSRTFVLESDVSRLSVSDSKTMELGVPVPDAAVAAGVVLSGPKSEMDAVSRLVATVSSEDVLSDTAVFTAQILAYGEDGRAVDISHCSFDKLTDHSVSLTVPVNVEQTLPVKVDLAHVPSAYEDKEDLVKLSPDELKLSGPAGTLSALDLTIGSLDFDVLRPDSTGVCKLDTFITLPDSVSLAEGNTPENRQIPVTATLLSDLTTKQISFTPGSGNTTFNGLSASQKASLSLTRYTVTLVGTEKALKGITADNLTASVSFADVSSGMVSGTMRFSVSGSNNVWVYYGVAGGTAVQANITND